MRSDDGIAAIKREIHCCPPTFPKLAEALANTDKSVFIDACLASENFQVQVQLLLPNSYSVIAGHTIEPRSLAV
ncbi:hypothetical protein [Nostoc sp.]|uniref:hypothetical protein n=1 Tax=Nostoc sp. TaxID=1180 RepID=UPI002FF7DDF0